jgi:hypothetical protein
VVVLLKYTYDPGDVTLFKSIPRMVVKNIFAE